MESKTVKELRTLAKQHGLKGYSKLRKAELIDLINPHVRNGTVLVEPQQETSLLDEPIPDIGVHPIQPRRTKKKVWKWIVDSSQRAAKKVRERVNKFADWIMNVPAPIIKLDSTIEELKKCINKLYKSRPDFTPKLKDKALKGWMKSYEIEGKEGYDLESFMKETHANTVKLIEDSISEMKGAKVKLIAICKMVKTNISTGDTIDQIAHFQSLNEVFVSGTDISDTYKTINQKMFESMAQFQREGSNWTLNRVLRLEIHINKYAPLSGSSYIPLPPKLAQKKAIVNVKNMEDNECFKWSVTSALYPVEDNADRLSKYKEHATRLCWDNITFPMTLKDIDRFERQNATISVNVYGYEDEVYPLRISKVDHETVVNLLLISEDDKQHYCWIKNMSRLLSSQTSKKKVKHHYCLRCLNSFYSRESLEKHTEYCYNNEAVKIVMPEEGSTVSFDNFNRSMRVPFIVYADFESFIKPIDTCEPNPDKSYMKQYQKHTPSSFCYFIKGFDDKVYTQEPVTYTAESEDEDVAQKFVVSLEADIKEICNKPPKKMIFGKTEKVEFEKATKCWICQSDFNKDDEKVRDHCHFTGKYRGAAHNKCNLMYKKPKFTPVVFHNLSGYDSHLFIKNLGKNEGNINCIPNNEEKYISFTKEVIVDSYTGKDGKEKDVKHQLRFIDSFKFMASSLDKLTDNLSKDCFINTLKYYNGKQLDLLLRKGVYPYEYMDSVKRLSETSLPPIEAFYSRLSGECISDDDYKHAQNVWKQFGMKTLRDYHDLYNQSDVLLLADVFENFRDVCSKNYGLDPAWYYTAPGLAWDAALKMTGVKLELLTDVDMLLMIEKGIRGGISTISTRYGKANNPYMEKEYDPNQPTTYIPYLDANNLYGWAMSKPLPTHRFQWMSEDELLGWKKYSCILEIDLEYPKHLHDLHNDYPLAPETVTVGKVDKLIPNLNNKTKYVIHYENLKLYESLGLKITKIHRGIKFEESPWLKQYIDMNTNLRAQATNDFDKDFFKLMNNSVFGKTMENIRKRVDVRLITSEKQAKKLVSKPNFHHRTIFNENLAAVHMRKTKLMFNKPVYLGMCILDISKILMYDFHYNYIKTKFGPKAKLLFTDTDSLAYEVETKDFYKDISGDVAAKFDTSNFPKGHPSGIESGHNKKVVGMFKDESGGKQIEEFVGLRAKLYAYKLNDLEEKKCKGVKKPVVKRSINFEDYKECLFTKREQLRKMNVIRSHRHEVYTEEVNKVALSANDDKRVILEDGIHTLAYGHYSLRGQ